jgi:primosomal protein N'
MVAEEENTQPAAAAAAPVPPPVTKAAGGKGPTLNKDGTERKKREPKKAKQQQPASMAQQKQQPTKEQLDAQRNVMRETLKQLKEKRLGEGGEDEDAPFEIESVYDLALGLELWLRDNSKVSAPVLIVILFAYIN